VSEHSGAIRRVIKPASKSLGDFTVRRALPDIDKQRIGPFVFFDHMGPAEFAPGAGVDVRPHPHIGLATVTYLFEGQIRHRDSLGFDQVIRPGAVNWMTAGRGVVHSERTPDDLKISGSKLHGIQAWIALPMELEETEPDFVHYDAGDIPQHVEEGICIHLIAGEAFGMRSPVAAASETLYFELDMDQDSQLELPTGNEELGIYVVQGKLDCGGQPIESGRLAVLSTDVEIRLRAVEQSKCMVIGGRKLEGDRIVWWNFVSSSRQRIEQAKRDWREGRFAPVPGDPEFIPLPSS
jgi:redox-sensitive bicupin YhaK (pirin superfamily)